jgi:hypothetical protein
MHALFENAAILLGEIFGAKTIVIQTADNFTANCLGKR